MTIMKTLVSLEGLTEREREHVEARQKAFAQFLGRYPDQARAWIERVRSVKARGFWTKRKAGLLCLAAYFEKTEVKVPSLRDLNEAWFRVAYWELVALDQGLPKEYRLTIKDVAEAFEIAPDRAYRMAERERKWRKRRPLTHRYQPNLGGRPPLGRLQVMNNLTHQLVLRLRIASED